MGLKMKWLQENALSILGGFFLILVFGIPTIFSEIWVWSYYREYRQYDDLNQKFYITEGTIKNITVNRNINIRGIYPNKIIYEFQRGGASVTNTLETLDVEKANELKPGDAVAVNYNDTTSSIAGLEPLTMPLAIISTLFIFFLIFFGIPALIGLILVLYAIFALSTKTKTYRTGSKIMGVFKGYRTIGRNQFLVSYCFTPIKGGAEIYARQKIEDYSTIAGKKEGDNIEIVYDPNNLDRHYIYESNLYTGQQIVLPHPLPDHSTRSWLIALILCFFFGFLGIHRFYVGKVGTGILMLLTAGGLGIWTFIDFIMILLGKFQDAEENYV